MSPPNRYITSYVARSDPSERAREVVKAAAQATKAQANWRVRPKSDEAGTCPSGLSWLSPRHGRACPGHPRMQTPTMSNGYVYILTNRPNGVLYVGVTSDLARRVAEHREGVVKGFTKQYGLKRLVYFEAYDDIRIAIQREKNMKHWSRTWKVRLILGANPRWDDLFESLL